MICKSVKQIMIHCEKHEISTIEQIKIGLNWFDDKRYLINGETDTLYHDPRRYYNIGINREYLITLIVKNY